MFASIVLVCGLTVQGPFIVEGCGLAYANAPFLTREACVENQAINVPLIEVSLPTGAYISDTQCVKMVNGVPS